ncbi:peptidase domain-containing ABC transporter [Bacillus pseudomycoides]|uniref:peptidase domain-containing ABC transporter n=1 Tax=Bacillus pseudomycoides TaxID=64104 RepID=UPI000BEC3A24|nr:peptidase domain-containing ABC transporter [Bacillus pseudomycoides]PDY44654.1 ABC transporter ATP-binding protein [Bacillus pseudomycoides]PGD90923.1 ABC transporter ATP-binding protein [Bacillus pseudomycoides]PHB44409.1 ABC transporter ATP-binding protein [Bacillus pseudomycoides]PHE65713.1 ABC transporter ATP-binding protein [Bacillus pseudomycoides]
MYKNNFIHTRQLDKHDCGLACISSILKFHGLNYGIDYLRDLTFDKKGYSLKDLISLFKKFDDFSCKPVQVDKNKLIDVLERIKTPCIALTNYDNEGHYIVVYRKEKNHVVISDPEEEKITKISIEEFNNVFSGVMLIVEGPKKAFNTINNSSYKKTFFQKIIKENIRSLIIVFLLSLLLVILTVGLSMFLKFVVDLIIPMHLDSYLFYLGIIFLISNLFRVSFDYIRNLFILKISYRIDKNISKKYFDKITKMPINFFKNRDDGEIISRFNDSSYIRNIFSVNIVSAVLDIIIVLGISFILFKINHILFFTALLPLLLIICLTIIFYEILEKRNKNLMINRAKTTSFLVQFIKNMPTIYAFNKKEYFSTSFEKIFDKQLNSTMKELKTVNNNNTLRYLINSSSSIIILWIGSQQVLNDAITLGTLLLINSLVLFLINSLDRLINVQSDLQKAFVAADRFLDILNYPTNKTKQTKKLQHISKIQFHNFSFSFDAFNNIIENVNLSILKNEKILLVGESGVGKSTFAQTLVKFYNVEQSKIFINDIDINNFNEEELRKKIIYLNENPFLFKNTIEENLCMGKIFDKKSIIKACQVAEIYDLINSLPKGFEFHLNENASNLSTGQKQRLSLARAILHHPNVLILDESLSNVDSKTFKQIYSNLSKLECTIVFITHNPEIINDYDRKFIFKDKTIKEFITTKAVNV